MPLPLLQSRNDRRDRAALPELRLRPARFADSASLSGVRDTCGCGADSVETDIRLYCALVRMDSSVVRLFVALVSVSIVPESRVGDAEDFVRYAEKLMKAHSEPAR